MSFEILHQKVHWEVDFDNQTLLGQTEIRLRPLEHLTEFRLNNRQCTDLQVFVNNKKASFTNTDYTCAITPSQDHAKHRGSFDPCDYRGFFSQQLSRADRGELLITPPSKLTSGQEAIVLITFELRDPLGGIHFVLPRDGVFEDRPKHMYTSAGVCETRLFLPCVDAFGEPVHNDEDMDEKSPPLAPQYPLWDLQFTVPENMMVVSAGMLQKQLMLPDGRNFFHFHLPTPTAACGIGFAVGPFEMYQDPKVQGTTHFCPPGLIHNLAENARVYSIVEQFFVGMLAQPMPYEGHQIIYVDEAAVKQQPYAGLTIMSASVISSERIIEQVMTEKRALMARAVVTQYFSHAVAPKSCLETWIVFGIIGYLTGLFIEYTFGVNEYKFYLLQELDWLIEHEHDRREALGSRRHTHPIEYCSDFIQRKSSVIMRMIERLIGKENLLEIFKKMLCGITKVEDTNAALADSPEPDDDDVRRAILVQYDDFREMLIMHSQKNLVNRFYSNWIERPGYAHLKIHFAWDYNTNAIRLKIHQDEENFFGGTLPVGVQDIDAYTQVAEKIHDAKHFTSLTLETKFRKNKKKRVRLSNDTLFDVDTMEDNSLDHPVLWISIDPDFEWYRKVTLTMPKAMWKHCARNDRRVTEQIYALRHLGTVEDKGVYTELAKWAGSDKKPQMFWRVKEQIYRSLSNSAIKDPTWREWIFIMKRFNKNYGIPLHNQLVGRNDFIDLVEYFLQKSIIRTISASRSSGGFSSKRAFTFLKDLIEMNDNTDNMFDDSAYIGCLLIAFAECVNIPSGRKSHINKDPNKAKEHAERVIVVLDTIARTMNMDKLQPSFHNIVTSSGLESIFKLQANGAIPLQTKIFKEHALYGHHKSVRLTALNCLSKLVSRGDISDLNFLLEIADNDHTPQMRYAVFDFLASAEPFINSAGSIGSSGIYDLITRLWEIMNVNTAYDIRTRVAALNFFETILPPKTKLSTTGSIKKIKLNNDSGLQVKLNMSMPDLDTFYSLDNETPAQIAKKIPCNLAELMELNQRRFEGITRTSKLMINTSLHLPRGTVVPEHLEHLLKRQPKNASMKMKDEIDMDESLETPAPQPAPPPGKITMLSSFQMGAVSIANSPVKKEPPQPQP